jgi:hypothetical protein
MRSHTTTAEPCICYYTWIMQSVGGWTGRRRRFDFRCSARLGLWGRPNKKMPAFASCCCCPTKPVLCYTLQHTLRNSVCDITSQLQDLLSILDYLPNVHYATSLSSCTACMHSINQVFASPNKGIGTQPADQFFRFLRFYPVSGDAAWLDRGQPTCPGDELFVMCLIGSHRSLLVWSHCFYWRKLLRLICVALRSSRFVLLR